MLSVREVMTKDVATVSPEMPVKDAAAMLAEKNISGLPVVEGGRIIGIFSEEDVLQAIKTTRKDLRLVYPSISSLGIAFQEQITQREIIEAYGEIGHEPVRRVMSRSVSTVPPDVPLNDAIKTMVEKGVHRLPVVEKGTLVGIVTRSDVIRGLAKEYASNSRPKQ